MRKTQTLLSLLMAAGLYGCDGEPMGSRDAGQTVDAAKIIDPSITPGGSSTPTKTDARAATNPQPRAGDAGARPLASDNDGGVKPPIDDPRPGRDNDAGPKPPAEDPRPGRDNDAGPKPPAEDPRPGRDNDAGPKPPADDDDGGRRPGRDNEAGRKPPANGDPRPGRDDDAGPQPPTEED